MSRVLVLGAGLVVKPLLDYLLSLPEVELHLAALNLDRARRLLAGQPRSSVSELNVTDPQQLRALVAQSAVVVSLIPADHHVQVARCCLDLGVPLVTTSYVSDGMRALDAEARRRGVLLLNEVGLDPGIDHMTAVQVIRRVHREGGRVLSLASYCGALPAPECNTNPWGYKFAWSPRGVVTAGRNAVRYRVGGQDVELSFPHVFDHSRQLELPGVGRLEAYPNRDCLRFLQPYGLQEVEDFFRGTLRYPGWCETWHALSALDLLDLEPRDFSGLTYAQFLERHLPSGSGGLVQRLARRLGLDQDHDIIARFEWLGLLSDRPIPETVASPLDILTQRLQRKLEYRGGERDMVILEHQFLATRPGGTLRRITKRLLEFGGAGDDSALARTVSYPAAIAARLILERQLDLTGVQIPVDPQLTDPILLGLERRGIHTIEEEAEPEAIDLSVSG